MSVNRLHRVKSINALLVILLLGFQITQISNRNDYSATKFSETSFQIYYYSSELSAARSNLNPVKQNPERNFTSFHYLYDKNDLIAISDITDSRRIYNGGFSATFRFKTFLTVIFSTST
ncbi:MAG TPA: hypothetical protein PK073_14450 [Ignavibacteriaceae bacterium]|nr:MAG: hypothetical protein BWY38_03035 [Ignavibacteria bacterium ADurb.Bin266]HQF44107.1 hypothetical protein [Ignavibacteriaceae bacterium]HQI42473.1 hypothetical protein [Ignavibacteriaceae bacterium]HQJ46727.1 hypothetical protein [Ignavibacteriaceae bacterium]